ncbi:ABC transporter ATP-binding protein/permease [Candidatus Dependentiae bacterium]|nr:ABC transporter ATP-binding protein/permease [Candidatus Dependentiae bacterium]
MDRQVIPQKNTSYLKNLLKGLIFFKSFNRTHWFSIILSAVCIIATIILSFCLPLAQKIAINALEKTTQNTGILWPLALICSYALTWFARQVIMQARELFALAPFEHLITIISEQTFAHLLKLPMSFHAHRRLSVLTGLFKKVQLNIPNIYHTIFYWVVPLIIESIGAVIIVYKLYGFFFSTILTLTLVFYAFTINYFSTMTRIYRQRFLSILSSSHSFFTDTLLHAETVKSFCREKYEIEEFKKINFATARAQVTYGTVHTSMHLIEAIILGTGITIFSLKAALLTHDFTFSLGDFLLLNGYVLQFALPLSTLGHLLRYLQTGLIDLGSILDVLDIAPDKTVNKDLPALTVSDGTITFKNISFFYTPERVIFENISCSFPGKKTIGIVGSSGCGKSTISRLITRQYHQSKGHIFIDDQDISHVSTPSLRSQVAVVPQECTLFNNTIFFNIAYGCPNATAFDVFNAARAAMLEDFIKKLPHQFETVIGERGLRLSGGERQRIAIARALLKKAPIYIFDEATSALDNRTEQQLQKNLTSWCADSTVIHIAHRLSSITHSDIIYYFEHGTIIEQGTHDQLLALNKKYADLWNKQQRNGEE